jgi:hypothetical protein
MAVLKCVPIHGSAGAPTYSASDIRNMLAALTGGTNFEAVTPGIGARARGHGVLSSGAMAVTANGTPNNHVFVAPGLASLRGTQNNDQGTYICPLSASFDITVPAAHATLDRKDLIVAQVKDGEFAAFAGGTTWTPELVQGTAAGSPVDPTVPEDCLVLARLLVRDSAEAGGTIIRTQDITDLRVQYRVGGITPVAAVTDWPNPQADDIIFNRAKRSLLVRNAANTQWEVLASSGAGVNYTPTLYDITIGNGYNVARYRRIGRTIVADGMIIVGTTTNIAANIFAVGLPTPAVDTSGQFGGQFYFHGAARAFDGTAGYAGVGIIRSGTAGAGERDRIYAFTTAGANGWMGGGSAVPFIWGVGDGFTWFAEYEAATAEDTNYV